MENNNQGKKYGSRELFASVNLVKENGQAGDEFTASRELFSNLSAVVRTDYAETIEDYKGFKIDIFRLLDSAFVEDGVYILINDVNTHSLAPRTSISHAEVIAKVYIEDVLIPHMENGRFADEKAEKE